MKVKVQEIPSEGIRFSLADYPVGRLNKDLVVEGPLGGKLLITRQGGNDLHIRGTISARILLACCRCLIPFGHPVQTEFYVDCTPIVKTGSGQEHRLYGEELNLHFYQGDVLDLDEIIQSQIYLETPMAPLCQADCAGLCPSCGEKLEKKDHDCLKKKHNL